MRVWRAGVRTCGRAGGHARASAYADVGVEVSVSGVWRARGWDVCW